MLANRIAQVLGGILSWITLPISLVTNLGGGCLVAITFGLILIPLTLIWMVFLGLLLGISWLWERAPWPLQVLLAIPGIPIAAIGYVYVLMIPSPGEPEATTAKLLMCQTFPYEMDLLRYQRLQRHENTGGTAALSDGIRTLPPFSDPGYAAARAELGVLRDKSLAEMGLNSATYDRIANILAVIEGY